MTRLSDNKRERKQHAIFTAANAPGADIEILVTCILPLWSCHRKVWRIDRVLACRILKSPGRIVSSMDRSPTRRVRHLVRRQHSASDHFHEEVFGAAGRQRPV
jgi:hypothetical protein